MGWGHWGRSLVPALLCLSLLLSCTQDRVALQKQATAKGKLGNAMIQEGQKVAGLRELKEAVDMEPGDVELQQALALGYRENGRYDLAIAHFKIALSLDPRNSQVRNNLGTVYLLKHQPDEAIPCFLDAVADPLYETPGFAWNNLGLAYSQKGEHLRAIEAYGKAIRLSPALGTAYFNLGKAYEDAGQWQEAFEAYREARGKMPDNQAVYMGLGRVSLKLGMREEARAAFTRAVALDSNPGATSEARAILRTMEGK